MTCSMTWIMLQTCWKTTEAGLEKGFRHTAEKKASLIESLQLAWLPFWQRGDDRGHRKGPKGPLEQRWSTCVEAWETGKVEVVKAGWGESGQVGGWVGGQGGSGADVSTAEDGWASRKNAVPSMPLLQPGAGRGGEENRDKIKLQARSAHSSAAANRLTNRQSFSAQPYIGF